MSQKGIKVLWIDVAFILDQKAGCIASTDSPSTPPRFFNPFLDSFYCSTVQSALDSGSTFATVKVSASNCCEKARRSICGILRHTVAAEHVCVSHNTPKKNSTSNQRAGQRLTRRDKEDKVRSKVPLSHLNIFLMFQRGEASFDRKTQRKHAICELPL